MRLRFQHGDDWVRVFDGDALIYEGHSIPDFRWKEWLNKAGVSTIDEAGEYDEDGEWIPEVG